MNYAAIDQYMKNHDFLKADVEKVHGYIDRENRTRNKQIQFTDGKLTRTELILTEANGTENRISRLNLGIQENFI